jgi:hypothetical protein
MTTRDFSSSKHRRDPIACSDPVKTISYSPKVPRITNPQAQGNKFILIALLGLVNTASSSYLWLENVPEYSDNTGKSIYYIFHRTGRLEGQDGGDGLWENVPPAQYPFWLRLSSNPWGKELQRDSRPFTSITPVEVSSDVMSRDAPSGEVICDNHLWVREINNTDGAFTGKPITFQQQSLSGNLVEKYPVFDIRRAKDYNSGRINIYDPNGAPHKLNRVYNDGETDWKGTIRFDRNISDLNDDKVVDIKDLALLVGNWMQEGFALPGDISGEFGIPDGRVDLFDLGVMAEEWGVRFVAL